VSEADIMQELVLSDDDQSAHIASRVCIVVANCCLRNLDIMGLVSIE